MLDDNMISQRGDRSEYISRRLKPDANIVDDNTKLNRDVTTTTQIVCQACQCAARLQSIDFAEGSSIVLDVSESKNFSKETRVPIMDVALTSDRITFRKMHWGSFAQTRWDLDDWKAISLLNTKAPWKRFHQPVFSPIIITIPVYSVYRWSI